MPRANRRYAAIALFFGVAAAWSWVLLHGEREAPPPIPGALPATVTPASGTAIAAMPAAADEDPESGAALSHEEKPGSSPKLDELQRRYPGLVAALQMTAAEGEAFYDLLQRQEAAMNSAFAGSGNLDLHQMRQKSAEIQLAQAAELAAQLGATRFQQLQEYRTIAQARRRVNELTSMLAASSPVTEQQAGPLLASVITEQKRQAQEESMRVPAANDQRSLLDFEEQNLNALVESNRRTVDGARSFMSAEQIGVLQDTMARFTDRKRGELQTRRAELEREGK